MGEFLSISEAAYRCGVSTNHLRRLADADKIPCLRVNRARLFRVADLDSIRRVVRENGFAFAEMPAENARA